MATQYTEPEPNPMFWDDKAKTVYHGIKLCPDPFPVASLAGTYRWIFLSQTSWEPIEFRYESDPEIVKKEYPGFPGFLTISFPEDEKPSLENLSGTFRFWDIKGSFTGVKSRKAHSGDTLTNAWDINYMKWDPYASEDTYDITEGHGLEVSDTLDDNGNRFVTLIWDQGYSGCCPSYGEWVGKKQSDEEALVGLSDAERERLSMYLTEEQVEENATTTQVKEEPTEVAVKGASTKNKRKVEDEDRDVKRKREE